MKTTVEKLVKFVNQRPSDVKSYRQEMNEITRDKHDFVVYVGKENINLLMVNKGGAWKFMCNDPKYQEAEQWARIHKIGLWAYPAIEPYLWRKQYLNRKQHKI